jgi:hypothetical protein
MEHGWDPEVKKYFQKILNTIFVGLLWMVAVATAGIRYELAWQTAEKSSISVYIFYAIAVITFLLLLRYYYKLWK